MCDDCVAFSDGEDNLKVIFKRNQKDNRIITPKDICLRAFGCLFVGSNPLVPCSRTRACASCAARGASQGGWFAYRLASGRSKPSSIARATAFIALEAFKAAIADSSNERTRTTGMRSSSAIRSMRCPSRVSPSTASCRLVSDAPSRTDASRNDRSPFNAAESARAKGSAGARFGI